MTRHQHLRRESKRWGPYSKGKATYLAGLECNVWLLIPVNENKEKVTVTADVVYCGSASANLTAYNLTNVNTSVMPPKCAGTITLVKVCTISFLPSKSTRSSELT